MMKNDYRRALIMLRALEGGLSGYVRLERRTLMGSMQFNVSGLRTTASLQAAMGAKTAAGWKIVHIGTLGQNMRGQAGLNWTFDPRCIEGLPLEKYQVLLVLAIENDSCRALMTGYVNGSVQVDWQRVEEAACASYASHAAKREITEEEPVLTGEEPVLPEEKTEAVFAAEDALDIPAQGTVSALQALGLGEEAAWPEGIAPLKEAFSAGEPMYLSALPEHVFIRAWHSAKCPECAVGLEADGGEIKSVAWAVPGEEAQVPPEGLEGYVWKDGWWIAVADAHDGGYREIFPR